MVRCPFLYIIMSVYLSLFVFDVFSFLFLSQVNRYTRAYRGNMSPQPATVTVTIISIFFVIAMIMIMIIIIITAPSISYRNTHYTHLDVPTYVHT
ncbi:hypothetical protein F4809DRAFT_105676 [Biscogniauxia mediterranea]|nr:hypothetical protein F4809DRAFT_105676 [Biscogniauxia mediterranea]